MILYLNTKKNDALLDSVTLALNGYFSEILVNTPIDKQQDNFAEITLEDDKIILQQNDSSETFKSPLKIGDILQKIQISRQNLRTQKTSAPIEIGKHVLYPEQNILKMGKNKISLTDKEFDIIHTIFKSNPKRIARDELLHAIWGYGEGIETHTLETHIYRLRQKIEKDPSNPKFLRTDDEGYYLHLA